MMCQCTIERARCCTDQMLQSDSVHMGRRKNERNMAELRSVLFEAHLSRTDWQKIRRTASGLWRERFHIFFVERSINSRTCLTQLVAYLEEVATLAAAAAPNRRAPVVATPHMVLRDFKNH
jgi:hypothetical protein